MTTKATIFRQEINGFPVLQISGYFDETLGQDLAELVDQEILNSRFRILLNLENCPIVNSLGISRILEIGAKLRDYDGLLVIAHVRPVITGVFAIAGVSREVQISQTLADGLLILQKA